MSCEKSNLFLFFIKLKLIYCSPKCLSIKRNFFCYQLSKIVILNIKMHINCTSSFLFIIIIIIIFLQK